MNLAIVSTLMLSVGAFAAPHPAGYVFRDQCSVAQPVASSPGTQAPKEVCIGRVKGETGTFVTVESVLGEVEVFHVDSMSPVLVFIPLAPGEFFDSLNLKFVGKMDASKLLVKSEAAVVQALGIWHGFRGKVFTLDFYRDDGSSLRGSQFESRPIPFR